jgi:hypothetical protein
LHDVASPHGPPLSQGMQGQQFRTSYKRRGIGIALGCAPIVLLGASLAFGISGRDRLTAFGLVPELLALIVGGLNFHLSFTTSTFGTAAPSHEDLGETVVHRPARLHVAGEALVRDAHGRIREHHRLAALRAEHGPVMMTMTVPCVRALVVAKDGIEPPTRGFSIPAARHHFRTMRSSEAGCRTGAAKGDRDRRAEDGEARESGRSDTTSRVDRRGRSCVGCRRGFRCAEPLEHRRPAGARSRSRTLTARWVAWGVAAATPRSR